MILQEEFKKNNYTDILKNDIAAQYDIDLEDIFELDQVPKELLGIFISEQRDDLFFLLNGDITEINFLCDQWDDRIRIFTLLNGNSESFQKLKYNIVQLVIYTEDCMDKNREANLMISRKIIIKGKRNDKGQIEIDDEEAIELPFHMISPESYGPDVEKTNKLEHLLPDNKDLMRVLERERKKGNRIKQDDEYKKIFEKKDFDVIKEWLEG